MLKGAHVPHRKNTAQMAAVRMPAPKSVTIPVVMHIGAPATPCVKKGDHVKLGQVIGTANGFVSLPVHASISGEVTDVAPIPFLLSSPVMAVSIKNDFLDEWTDDLSPLGAVDRVDPKAILPAIARAGICGMGGASFPTHVKLTFRENAYCDTIIVNGAECETHLTADHRLMIEHGVRVVDGLRAAMRATGVSHGVIAIEDNKPEAIEAMRRAASGREGVRVQPLKTK